jgi:PAS domain-containing protein
MSQDVQPVPESQLFRALFNTAADAMIVVGHNGRILLANPKADELFGYAPRQLIGRYYVPTLEGWRDWPLVQHGALWGGEPAGALLTNYLRPGELTIYADKLPGMLAAQQKFLKTPAPGHTAVVEVRRKFWHFPGDAAHPDLTPPILVYADLLATGDGRCIETAKLVYDEHVARLFGNT